MPEPFSAERLRELKARLDRDPTSRTFLQLAEEYRRAGRLAEAIQVLEAGVRIHPAYVAAQVVLGRTLLENGDPARAAVALQRAVELDPTQLVANRLLVETHLAMGETRAARERLDLYRLLNDRDTEIDRLDERIRELGGPPGAGSAKRRPIAGPSTRVRAPSFELPPPPAQPLMPLAAAESSPPSGRPKRSEQPFGPLLRFPFPGAPSAKAFAAASIFEIRTRHRATAAPLPPPSATSPPLPAPPPALAFEREDATAIWEPAVESQSAAPAPAEIEPEVAVAPPDLLPEGRMEEAPRQATSTLGELYLQQGHLADAEESFEAVLEARPADSAALAGLAEVRRRREEAEAAFFEVPGEGAEEQAAPVSAVGGLSSRKIVILRAFLQRMRKGSASHVS